MGKPNADAAILDKIIRERRSHRALRADVPDVGLVEKVIDAGMHAPYAALAYAGRTDFRRFFAIKGGGDAAQKLKLILGAHFERMAKRLSDRADQDPAFAEASRHFRERLAHAAFPEAPWIVVVAEPVGVPPATPQSLAHCFQNMWLMATALGLGMQLLSVFESMGEDEDLCRLLGLDPGAWCFNACTLGYPVSALPPSERPDARDFTTWLE
ncbi:MAG: nitroreductase family protein [bacterium]